MIESKHAVSPVTPISGAQSSMRPGRSSGQRSNFALCIAPLLLLGATCAGAAIQRSMSNHSAEVAFGHMSRVDAYNVTNSFFMKLNGTPPTITDASTQSAYSVRRKSIVREWSVLCSAPDGEYLLRINADTRRVYAINRMDDNNLVGGDGKNIMAYSNHNNPGILSHREAELRARDYASLIGISPSSLTLIVDHVHQNDPTAYDSNEPEWNFTFRRVTGASASHLVTVSIRSKDGRLEHMWNPVFSI